MSEGKTFRVLAIGGSLRKGSYNRCVINALPELAPANVEIVIGPSFGDFPLYDSDLQAEGFPAPVRAMGDAIRAADGVVIVTPEYNYSVPGYLKNGLDWISRLPDTPFFGKPVALQSAAMSMLGGARAQYHLRQILVFLDVLVFNKPEVFITFAQNKIDAEGRLHDQQTRDFITQQLTGFAAFMDRVGDTKKGA
ncbi:chromate reductase [Faunimonas pinastri]|uniref:Chromate reductase n=1 Tax=Faunimonas pinastri TaxID=1855383 RepID=A0A1H8ZZ76_9HYPH|nr:NADPH-dependent FMN reductase [Faunimonas pinastri]SEP69557.1 chromate reductase [Faunimonas pinastri]